MLQVCLQERQTSVSRPNNPHHGHKPSGGSLETFVHWQSGTPPYVPYGPYLDTALFLHVTCVVPGDSWVLSGEGNCFLETNCFHGRACCGTRDNAGFLPLFGVENQVGKLAIALRRNLHLVTCT